MATYECPCGYVYDPAEGDYENGIEPGTAFDDLPDVPLWFHQQCHTLFRTCTTGTGNQGQAVPLVGEGRIGHSGHLSNNAWSANLDGGNFYRSLVDMDGIYAYCIPYGQVCTGLVRSLEENHAWKLVQTSIAPQET